VEWVVIYLLFCIGAASMASRKNRSGIGYFLLALLLSPLLALIIVACLRPLPRPQARQAQPAPRPAPARLPARKPDPRWQNLRAGVELETEVRAAALASVNAIQRKRSNREILVATMLLAATIVGALVYVFHGLA